MSFFDLEQFISWISNNPDWALAIVFAIAFIESLAVVGLLMPGWLLLVGVGVLIGTGNINFYLASLFCFAGAVIGEYLSFLVGVHYQQKVHNWRVFKRHPEWLANTEHFFQRFGIISIALGRFIGPVRAFVPLLAGMSSMPALRFQITNILSALVWAPVYLTPGVIIGASVQLEPQVRWIILSNLVVIVISLWFLFSFIKAKLKFSSLKVLVSFSVFCTSLLFLIMGKYHQQFLELVSVFLSIVNQ
ncbi:MAG: DedA family protein [Gammaproteobacteria bacterium]|nr:MAG: DedA family protein [Gammaproteobacteria bacterium]